MTEYIITKDIGGRWKKRTAISPKIISDLINQVIPSKRSLKAANEIIRAFLKAGIIR